MTTSATERTKILGRIREALRFTAPKLYDHTAQESAPASTHVENLTDWLPAVGPTFEDRVELFAKNSAELKSMFCLDDSLQASIARLQAMATTSGWKRIAAHRNELTEPAVAALNLPVIWTDKSYDVRELEQCDIGLTACDALVAQTGSVLVTTRTAGGRALSVLPPHHVVLARRDQLLPDLPAAFALLKATYGTNYPSFISVITGPSRTGDIERILVLGAHGPRELTLLCS